MSTEIRTAIGGAEPAFLDEHGNADADHLAGRPAALHFGVEFLPVDPGELLVDQSDVIAGVHEDGLAQRFERPLVGQFSGGEGVAAAHFDAVDGELCGDRVEQALAYERGFVAARRPIGRGRRLVGETEVTDRPVGRHAVRTGQNAGRHVNDARRVGSDVAALVVEINVVDGEDDAVVIDGGANLVQLLARMIGSDQMFAAVLDPFHRPVEFLGRDADQKIFRIHFAADAEAAADVRFIHMDRARRELEHAREQFLIAVRHLGGTVHFQNAARGVITADGAARLQRHAGMPANGEFKLDHMLGGAEHGIDVAVALADDCCFAGVTRRVLKRRRLGIKHRWQFLDFDLDKVGGVLGDIRVGGKHGGDRVTDITHLASRQDRLTVWIERRDRALAKIDRRHVGDVGRGPHRVHAGQRARG